jgi:hypothetical protein
MNIKNYCPIELNDLIRIGSPNDGGYVLPQCCIDNTEILLSFGISDDWNFEKDFSTKSKAMFISYDYSIKNSYIPRREDFLSVFDNKRGFYIPKFLDLYDDDSHICFNTIFNTTESNLILIKMDIEGGEFLVIPQLIPYLDRIVGLIIEFHSIDNNPQFEQILNVLLQKFYIAHFHGNNYSPMKNGIPVVSEITFINKKFVKEPVSLSNKKYPIDGIDSPCLKNAPDYILEFK